MEIGEKIKNLRMMQNLTQDELAQRSELTKGFISQIERDIASPSIQTLIDILDALGTNPHEFFSEEDEKIVFKNSDFVEHIDANGNYKLNWLVPNAQKNMLEPVLIELNPKGKSQKLHPFEGEVFGYVLSGNISLVLENKKHFLKEGESFYFQAKGTHQLINESEKCAKIIWVTTPPNF